MPGNEFYQVLHTTDDVVHESLGQTHNPTSVHGLSMPHKFTDPATTIREYMIGLAPIGD